jgi:hypothetical protein
MGSSSSKTSEPVNPDTGLTEKQELEIVMKTSLFTHNLEEENRAAKAAKASMASLEDVQKLKELQQSNAQKLVMLQHMMGHANWLAAQRR